MVNHDNAYIDVNGVRNVTLDNNLSSNIGGRGRQPVAFTLPASIGQSACSDRTFLAIRSLPGRGCWLPVDAGFIHPTTQAVEQVRWRTQDDMIRSPQLYLAGDAAAWVGVRRSGHLTGSADLLELNQSVSSEVDGYYRASQAAGGAAGRTWMVSSPPAS